MRIISMWAESAKVSALRTRVREIATHGLLGAASSGRQLASNEVGDNQNTVGSPFTCFHCKVGTSPNLGPVAEISKVNNRANARSGILQ
jgi:hypothetical protein